MVHLIVDDMTIYSEVYWVNNLIVAIFLVTVKVRSLSSMTYDALAFGREAIRLVCMPE